MEQVSRRPDDFQLNWYFVEAGRQDPLSEQTRRLSQLEPKYGVSQILGEVVSTEPGRSLEQTRTVSRRSEELSHDRCLS